MNKKVSNIAIKCPKCGKITPHATFDIGKKIFKCLVCNNLHV